MWKHKTKWLVRGGRKVRCYLCGKKILSKGDLFLFHRDTGYYSHQSCMTESTTISGNERRRAVKKIAVGAAVVGAVAAGAGKLIDISSQSKGSNFPAAQTILTSQGLIPPALTSDPANPVPGQMWYRSDAGVEAHFNGVQNRVVYSSEINDGNVHVTSKGIINGLSVLPNDGTGWFGPDTTKGATARGQYGSPYTDTYGWQESFNYIASKNGGSIFFSAGVYDFTNAPVQTSSNTGKHGKVIFPVITQDNYYGMQGVKLIFETPYWYNNIQTVKFTPSNVGYGVIIYDNQTPPSSDSDAYAEVLFDSPTNASGAERSMIQLETEGALGVYVPLGYVNGIDFGDICGLEGDTFVAATLSPTGNDITSYNSAGTGVGILSPTEGVYYPVHFRAINATYFSDVGVYLQSGGVTIDFLQTQANSSGVTIQNQLAPVYIHYWITLADDYALNIASIGSGKVVIDIILFANSQYSSLTPTYSFLYSSGSPTYVEIKAWDAYNDSTFFPTFSGFPAGSIKIPAKALQGQSFTPTISANPPVSGTAYQNTNPFDIRLKIPVTYSPTSSAAATLATGTSSSSTVTTSTKVSYPAGITTGIIETYEMVAKAGQYFELVVTNATIGTVEVQAA